MNRELKFRVWDKLAKRFIYPDRGYRGHYILDLNGSFYDLHNGSGGDEYVVQQYTGLQDKHGKDIYEGDIVEYNPDKPVFRIGIIEYSDYYNGWSIKDRNCYPSSEYGQYSLASPFLSFNNVKIIGNIFETPELLK